MKFLVASDSPTSPTGMANQIKFVAEALIKMGHDVDYMGWQNMLESSVELAGKDVRVFPSLSMGSKGDNDELFGKKVYPYLFQELNPDVLITLGDAWMVDHIPQYPVRPFWMMYFPVDGHPLNQNIIGTLQRTDVPIAMSKFGQDVCKSHGIETEYIPHQVNWKHLSKYKPKTKKKKAREVYFPDLDDDTMLFGSIARANPRKHHMRLFKAIENFVKGNNLTPDDVRFYLHIDLKDQMYHTRLNAHDYFLIEFIDSLGIGEYLILPPENFKFGVGLKEEELHGTMSAFDVHINSTGGEGFGVPTVETMAMGIPQVITDYTTSRELVAHRDIHSREEVEFDEMRGLLVPPSRLYMENSNVNKAWVDVDAFADAMNMYYEDRDLLKQHGLNAFKFSKQYDSKNVNKMWKELIEKIPQVKVIDV